MTKKKGKLYGLDLFSGIGGNTLGLGDYVRTIAYCEQDRHAQAVLLSRMGDGSIPIAPIWDDITTLTRDTIDIPIDIIVGGFPCQDISVAGKGAGLAGERSGLFYEIVRLAKEIQPTFLFLENVPAIRTRGLDAVVQELTALGYDLRWAMLSAAEVGAPHKRERWFLLAKSTSEGLQRELWESRKSHGGGCEAQREGREQANPSIRCSDVGSTPNVANTDRFKCERRGASRIVGCETSPLIETEEERERSRDTSGTGCLQVRPELGWWAVEPNVGRVANGVPQRVDRIKRLGNAVVPQQAKEAFEILMGVRTWT